ncbi:Smg-like protein [Kangiella geojedonensis]|uniref:Protein Smg homolog n=2 Tax=Kangiella geojedonensis TaxID=914150 RepID=A0A0F6TS67_9GAMM|nr:Smg-like protein [Kangiella geojedonensis]
MTLTANQSLNQESPMKEDVLDVLLYIFENFQDEESNHILANDTLVEALEDVGFTDGEIKGAIDWLDGLVLATSESFKPTPEANQSIRLFSPEEQLILTPAVQGAVMYFEQSGILDAHAREMVIDRMTALGPQEDEEVALERLRWVVMMVLFNMQDRDAEFAWVESLESGSCAH